MQLLPTFDMDKNSNTLERSAAYCYFQMIASGFRPSITRESRVLTNTKKRCRVAPVDVVTGSILLCGCFRLSMRRAKPLYCVNSINGFATDDNNINIVLVLFLLSLSRKAHPCGGL